MPEPWGPRWPSHGGCKAASPGYMAASLIISSTSPDAREKGYRRKGRCDTVQVLIEGGLASCEREQAGRYPMGVCWRQGKFFRKGCGRRRCSTKVIVRAIRQAVEKRGAPEGFVSSKGASGGAAVKMDEKKGF